MSLLPTIKKKLFILGVKFPSHKLTLPRSPQTQLPAGTPYLIHLHSLFLSHSLHSIPLTPVHQIPTVTPDATKNTPMKNRELTNIKTLYPRGKSSSLRSTPGALGVLGSTHSLTTATATSRSRKSETKFPTGDRVPVLPANYPDSGRLQRHQPPQNQEPAARQFELAAREDAPMKRYQGRSER